MRNPVSIGYQKMEKTAHIVVVWAVSNGSARFPLGKCAVKNAFLRIAEAVRHLWEIPRPPTIA